MLFLTSEVPSVELTLAKMTFHDVPNGTLAMVHGTSLLDWGCRVGGRVVGRQILGVFF